MAKEHGLEEHKGKTIPAEVRSLADRIRKKDPKVSDEYAYRTAWDIYRSHTAEGKRYPHKSSVSGLAREGGGTGPLSKKGSVNEDIWEDIVKQAMSTAPIKKVVQKATTAQGDTIKTLGVNWAKSLPQVSSNAVVNPNKIKTVRGG